MAAVEQLEQVGQMRPLLNEVERARRAAVRLQACLTLFAPCFPPLRIAFWKRRLRRLIRALNALSDHLHLMASIQAGSRLHLRLQQRIENLQEKAQQAWERLHREHIPNEIRGLAKRRQARGKLQEADDTLKEYARARWRELARVNLKGEPAGPAAQSKLPFNSHPVEVCWGRWQLMVEVAKMLAPLLQEELPMQTLQAHYRELSKQRFRARAVELLMQLKEAERALTLHYQGHLRGFRRIEREFDQWIQHFQSEMSDLPDLSDLPDEPNKAD